MLDLAALHKVRHLFHKTVQPLTLAELANTGRYGHDGVSFARQTHQQLQVRIAHRLNDFLFLPYKVMANPSINYVYQKYVNAYILHEEVGNLKSDDDAMKYWQVLADIFDGNRQVTRMLGKGRNELTRLDPALAENIDAFLDRFFSSRIGTSLAGAAFLHNFAGPEGATKPLGVETGVIQRTDVAACVRQLAESLAASDRGASCPVHLQGAASEVWIDYVPSHIQVILREILQNAMLASAIRAQETRREVEPVRVSVNRGRFGVFVTISDRGGGIDALDKIWSWGPLHPEAEDAARDSADPDMESREVEEDVPLFESYHDAVNVHQDPWMPLGCGAGFGAPLARLVARYFGGDVQLRTLLGHGTSAYIHIPELQRDISSMNGV